MINIQKINDIKVKPIPTKEDKRPIKGSDLFPKAYCNIFLNGTPESGKSTVLENIIEHCTYKNTTVIAFVSTLYADNTWLYIREWCEKRHVPFLGYMSIYENGRNLLEQFVEQWEAEAKERDEKKKAKKRKERIKKTKKFLLTNDDTDSEEDDDDKKYPILAPDYLVILDDLSDELHEKSVPTLMKKHRHFHLKVIISSQYLNDLPKSARKVLTYWIIFGGLDEEKLLEMYNQASLKVSYEQFRMMYNVATRDKYSFLYVCVNHPDFRINFNKRFTLPNKK